MKNVRKQLILPALLACTMLVGCYNGDTVHEFINQPRTPVSTVDYRVYPPDVLIISSDNMKEFEEEHGERGLLAPVNPDGKINVPLFGNIIVAGKTVAEIRRALIKASKDYYTEANVDVAVRHFRSQKYFVFGEVSNPGVKEWTGRNTVLEALAHAQPTPSAWPERIMIVRGDSPQDGGHFEPEDAKSKQYMYFGVTPEKKNKPRRRMIVNLMAMIKTGDMSHNVLLKPNDIVYVQANPFAYIAEQIDVFMMPARSFRMAMDDVRQIYVDVKTIQDIDRYADNYINVSD